MRPFVDFGRKAAAAVFVVHWPSNIDVIDRYYWPNSIAHVKLSENITSEFWICEVARYIFIAFWRVASFLSELA